MREKNAYHNTELLLRKYRDVVWSIEVSAMQAQISFEIEMGCKLEEFLEMSYAAGADLAGTDVQEQMRTMERNKKMLKIIESAVNLLKRKQGQGEEYYNIIYYTYKRLYLLMQTICSTGIRVSELKFITVEAVKAQKAIINLKGKTRSVFLPDMLCKMLLRYIKEEKIKSGSVFVSKNSRPLDRCNIYHDMKKLCESANVDRSKVFPHNLRHLFARTYYSLEKDISRLADILGHSSVNTTRIYTMETGEVHRKQIQKLGLLRC